jgi:hypothetical protein
MDEAIVNDGKIIEARTRRLYCLAEFIRLHWIAIGINPNVEIEFVNEEILERFII